MYEGQRGREAKEGIKSPEVFRGSLGIDFIFGESADGSVHCFCTEINGDNAGIAGVQDVPNVDKTKALLTQIRDRRDPAHAQKRIVAKELMEKIEASNVFLTEELDGGVESFKQVIADTTLFPNAFQNPSFIKKITSNKRLQTQYIPEQYRLRMYTKGDSPVSSTGFWIIKPIDGVGGWNIAILSNKEFADEFVDSEFEESRVAQEFMVADGAETAGPEKKHNPAAMRLLIDFVYREDGSIEPVFESAYQRVSPHSYAKTEYADNEKRPGRSDVFVVNRARGAHSYAVSPREYREAHEAAEAIIRNLGEAYRKSLEDTTL